MSQRKVFLKKENEQWKQDIRWGRIILNDWVYKEAREELLAKQQQQDKEKDGEEEVSVMWSLLTKTFTQLQVKPGDTKNDEIEESFEYNQDHVLKDVQAKEKDGMEVAEVKNNISSINISFGDFKPSERVNIGFKMTLCCNKSITNKMIERKFYSIRQKNKNNEEEYGNCDLLIELPVKDGNTLKKAITDYLAGCKADKEGKSMLRMVALTILPQCQFNVVKSKKTYDQVLQLVIKQPKLIKEFQKYDGLRKLAKTEICGFQLRLFSSNTFKQITDLMNKKKWSFISAFLQKALFNMKFSFSEKLLPRLKDAFDPVNQYMDSENPEATKEEIWFKDVFKIFRDFRGNMKLSSTEDLGSELVKQFGALIGVAVEDKVVRVMKKMVTSNELDKTFLKALNDQIINRELRFHWCIKDLALVYAELKGNLFTDFLKYQLPKLGL